MDSTPKQETSQKQAKSEPRQEAAAEKGVNKTKPKIYKSITEQVNESTGTNQTTDLDDSNEKNSLNSKTKIKSNCKGLCWSDYSVKYCLVCLTTNWFPLPHECGHVICFTCVIDVVHDAEHCPICHEPLLFYMEHNRGKLYPTEPERKEEEKVVDYQWSFKSKSVWNQYAPKTSAAIERNFNNNKHIFNLMINDIMYTFDLKEKVQYVKDHPDKKFKMKREIATFVNGAASTH